MKDNKEDKEIRDNKGDKEINGILADKYNRLRELIRGYGSVVIGFSGGVDSSLLTRLSYDILGSNVLCVIGVSSSYPGREEFHSVEFAKAVGVSYRTVETNELGISSYRENSGDRCYFCKKELYTKLFEIKDEGGFGYVLDGTNLSDIESDDRPGIRALRECGVSIPFVDVGLYKGEIRELARYLGLSSWDKPSFACLSSRIPEGMSISEDILGKIERGEDILYGMGFRQFRLRYHGDIARIQLLEGDFFRLVGSAVREELVVSIKSLGFLHVTLDLVPYREYS